MAPMLTRCLPHSNVELKDNTIIVVLGASGDLAKKKTVSKLFPNVPPNLLPRLLTTSVLYSFLACLAS
jgi:hypothetical protein